MSMIYWPDDIGRAGARPATEDGQRGYPEDAGDLLLYIATALEPPPPSGWVEHLRRRLRAWILR